MKSGCDFMRKGFKVLAAIMVVAMLCTMSLSAFAASHVTETTLENGVYTTTTTVTTDNSGEQVAYLVCYRYDRNVLLQPGC